MDFNSHWRPCSNSNKSAKQQRHVPVWQVLVSDSAPSKQKQEKRGKECAFPLKLRHAGAGGITNGAELLSVPLHSQVFVPNNTCFREASRKNCFLWLERDFWFCFSSPSYKMHNKCRMEKSHCETSQGN